MTTVIAQILPLAIAVALSTVPIIATILILLSDAKPLVSIALLIGWACGMAIILTALTIGVALIPAATPARNDTTVGVIRIVLGTALLIYSIGKWRTRSKGPSAAPRWMDALGRITSGGAFGFGAALALRPKNIVLSFAGAIVIGDASLPMGDVFIVVLIFTLIGVSTVAAPIIGHFSAPEKTKQPLDATRNWIVRSGSSLMLAVALMVSAIIIGSGIAIL
ncbi:GAP family protein [Mycetocola zhadangensis]|uniref:GAP family protein n=1 Tax=Mycetocola zhadangensis TaxID=1164595 RepID=A0A3L7J7P2_9MICO|nr:GAP family protein [Mycetocola zhadangensis]RLQ86375.1 GAP family protein [Mycetocola zhadangensis]GGE90666.1 membrane protein [Mycetocola zhadangensis]